MPCASAEVLHSVSSGIDNITVAWTDSTRADIFWYLEYDTVDFIPGDGTVAPILVTDSFYTMTGLDSGTLYHIYVYPDCFDSVVARHLTATTLMTTPTAVPYNGNFDNESYGGWALRNGTQSNQWTVGNAAGNPGGSLYITDDGSNNHYGGTSSTVFAVKTFHLETVGEYAYSFDWKCEGEAGKDYLRAALVPAGRLYIPGELNGFDNVLSPADGPLPLDGSVELNQNSSWQYRVGTFSITEAGDYDWVFVWHNDDSVFNQSPAAVDNVRMRLNSCPMPRNVSGTRQHDRISLVWVPGGDESEWEVELDGERVRVITPAYTFSGLSPYAYYKVGIRSVCGAGDTSLAVLVPFAPLRFYVNAVADDAAHGYVTGSGRYYYGDIATLTATPNSGYCFMQWDDGDTNNPRNITVTSDTVMTALFQHNEGFDVPQDARFEVNIYPNPAKGAVTVGIAGASGVVSVSVFDLKGREVGRYETQDPVFEFDAGRFKTGVYFIRVSTQNNAPVVKKLMVAY